MKRVLCLITGAALGLCLTAQASDATKQTAAGVMAHPQQIAGSGGSEHKLAPDVDVVEDLVTQFGENPTYTPAPQGGIAEFIGPCPVGPGQPNCQDPDAANGYGSTGRAGGFRMHEDLRTGGSAINITSICVLGLYSPGSTDGNDNITLQYFADAGNTPGASIGGPFVQGTNLTVARVQTGATLFGAPEWQHRLTHASVNIGANTCYWVRIVNDARTATNANRTWFWETSSGGNSRCISQSVNSGAFNIVTGDDLAICVEGVASLGDANSCIQLLSACPGGTQTGVRCTPQDLSNAINSTTGVFTTQDNFTVDVNGAITNLCWWGAYQGCTPNPPTDGFTVTYYNHNPAINGPGTIAGGPFTGAGLTVTRVQTGGVIAGVVNEFSYSATHAAVNVTAGTCYWVEIRNTLPAGCNWFWELGFDDGRCYVNAAPDTSDLAFCINVDRRNTGDGCVSLGDLCAQDPGNCHGVDPSNALSSSPTAAIADDFRSDADGGDIEEICWWGGYQDAQGGGCGGNPTDNFIITYYNHNPATGLPGSILAGPFTQGSSLTVQRQATGDLIAGVVNEFNYVGTHAPVTLAPNTCYWVEITNSVTACSWFWEFGFGGNGRSVAGGLVENNDFAFCVDAGMNGNDEGQCVAQPTDLCNESAGNCQARNIDNAAASSGATATADDFTPASNGNVTKICWWGAYVGCAGPDDFQVTYYNQGLDGGPGAQIAQFSQSGSTLTVTGPAASGDTIAGALVGLGWVGTHAAVPVVAGQCYWVEVKNLGVPGTCGWFWQDGEPTTGRIAQHDGVDWTLFEGNQAFCLNIALGDASTCVRAEGGCCLPNGDCIITTSAACGAQGGSYLGDDSNCGIIIATSAPGVAIPDGSTAGLDDVITIGAAEAVTIDEVLVGLLITHTWQGDIIARLTGPNAAVVTLLDRPGFPESTFGFSADNYGNPGTGTFMLFDDLAASTYDVPAVTAPGIANPTGTWLANTGLLSAYAGISSLGNWTLNVSDNEAADTGTLNAWRLIFLGTNPCPAAEACCFGDGSCLELTVAACNTAGGTPQGAGTDCDPNPCATANPGSCCFSNGLCNVQLAADCTVAGGIAGAPGSSCSPNPCPCVLGDANCDGVVNNFDIDPFVLVIVNNNDVDAPAGFPTPTFPTGATAQDCWDRRGCTCNINCDVDGVNNFDIDPFVACIVAGDSPCVCP